MKAHNLTRNLSQIWLTLVPVLTIIFGLGVGYISYKIYLPVWMLNVVLMIASMWSLGVFSYKQKDIGQQRVIIGSVLFIIPTLLTSMFFGLGAPPYESPALWVETITEQRVRYYFLLAAGLSIAFGFVVVGQQLKKAGEDFYSLLGLMAIAIASPVFLVNMSFWGFYLTRLYQQMVTAHASATPEYLPPLRTMFYYVNILVSALIYLATLFFSLSLKKTGWFKPSACNCYIVISSLFLVLDLLPPSLPDPFATLNFIVSIPAIPFMVPYFIGINLLRRAGNNNAASFTVL